MAAPNRMTALIDAEDDAAEVLLDQLARAHTAESRAADIVVVDVMHGKLRYSPALGWLAWDGMRWDTDEGGEEVAREAVRRYINTKEREARVRAAEGEGAMAAIADAITARCDEDSRKAANGKALSTTDLVDQQGTADEVAAFNAAFREMTQGKRQADMWLNLLSGAKLSSITKICRAMDGVLTKAKELDQHDTLLNCTNGVVDLTTGELKPHDPALLITKVTGGPYIPGAAAPAWTKALQAVHPDVVEWFQTRMGQTITGRTPDDDSMVISAGGGENGKSAVMEAVMRSVGDYGRLISHRVLIAQPGQHPTELMDLRGLRFALLEETPEEGRLDTHQLKMTIGTPRITARLMRANSVTFDATHTLWVNTNFMPQVDSTDHGTWRRLKAMPWPFKFMPPGVEPTEEHERVGDRQLKEHLRRDETVPAAVLAWAIAGAVRYFRELDGVLGADPGPVAAATEQWRATTDVGYQFASERLVEARGSFITAETMRREFSEFLKAQGKHEWSAQTLNTRLPESLKTAGISYDKDPTQNTKVRVSDEESRPASVLEEDVWVGAAAARAPIAPGKVIRMWRGVRFRTPAEVGQVLTMAG